MKYNSMKAILELTPEENETLLAHGRIEIDDPERGHIIVTLMFDENKPGIVGKHGKFTVLRPGTAARKTS
jgi:hypothetical protein